MTQAITAQAIDPITHEEYERIMESAREPQPGESSAEADLRGATEIATIGLMRDCMFGASELTNARWSELTRAEDGSGRLDITDRWGIQQAFYLSKMTMRWLDALADARRNFGDVEELVILPADDESLNDLIGNACSRADLRGTCSVDSPRAGMALDLMWSDFTLEQVMMAGRWETTTQFFRFMLRTTDGRSSLERWLGKKYPQDLKTTSMKMRTHSTMGSEQAVTSALPRPQATTQTF